MLHYVGLVRSGVSEECIASIIRLTRIGELGMLAVTSNQSTLSLCLFVGWVMMGLGAEVGIGTLGGPESHQVSCKYLSPGI
jgi:hypothetical protein